MRFLKSGLASMSTLFVTLLVTQPVYSQTSAQSPEQNPAPPITQEQNATADTSTWQSKDAKHVFGFPDIKPNKKGTLELSTDALLFTGKSGNTSIERKSITAVSAGDQRVELWGFTGRILKSAIPYSGGMAAAAVMHHRIDMLTVEFRDTRGTDHSAVFFLPFNEAQHALQSFALTPAPLQKSAGSVCLATSVDAKSVLVVRPDWEQAEVPAVYRSLVYEHVLDRLRRTKDAGRIYREGEDTTHTDGCPQYTVRMSIKTFKEGSSVKRAMLGPAGNFVGTTQMKFDVIFSDSSGRLNETKEIKATIRGESESTNVADKIAKSIAKRYSKLLKDPANNVAADQSPETLK